MDPLRFEAVERARRATPEERARQTIDLIEAGFELKRAALRPRNPAATDAEIEVLFREWLGRR